MRTIVFSTGLRWAGLLLLVTDLSGSPPARAQEQATSTEAGRNLIALPYLPIAILTTFRRVLPAISFFGPQPWAGSGLFAPESS